jgi:FG-GAP-like repeat/FG-GAP repeat
MRGSVALLTSAVLLGIPGAASAAVGFAPGPGSPLPTGTDHAFGLAAADINNDGKVDLVAAGHQGGAGPGVISTFLGNGNGTFTPRGTTATGGNDTRAVALGDMNNDAKVDAVVTNRVSGTVTTLLGDGAGGFTAGAPVPAGTFPTDVVVLPIDADNLLDIVVSNDTNPGTVTVRLGNGTAPPATSTAPNPTGIVAADFNLDGKRDVAVANGTSPGQLSMLLNLNANGTFCGGPAPPIFGACQERPFPPSGGDGAAGLAVGNLSAGDVAPDVVVSNEGSGSVAALLNSAVGNGVLRDPSVSPAGPMPGGPVIADFDADGNGDAAVPLTGSNAVAVVVGNGGGGLTPGSGSPFAIGANAPRKAVSADFDGDGQPDIATANDDGTVSVLRNTNAPALTFEPSSVDFGSQAVGTTTSARSINIRNTGTGLLDIRGIGTSGALGNDFPITGGTCAFGRLLRPGEACAATAAFRPGGNGPRTAGLVIFDNAPGSPHTAALSGTGTGGSGSGGDTTAPVITGLRADPPSFAVGTAPTAISAKKKKKKPKRGGGTTFRFTVSEPAHLQLALRQMLPGKRKGKRCVKPSRKLKKAKKCTRLQTAGALRRTGTAGANAVPFSGRVGRKALKPGRYQVEVAGSDDAGNKSAAVTTTFRVKRR